MKPFISLLFILLQFSTHGHATTHSDIVTNTCKRCSSGDPNVDYKMCIDSFNSVPKSHNSDLKGLGVIAINIAVNNATSIKSRVSNILNKHRPQGADYTKSCLEDCLQLYSMSVSRLSDSANAIKDGSYGDANVWISSALDTPSTCEDGFREGRVESPLTKENSEFTDHVAIALAITAMLQGRGN